MPSAGGKRKRGDRTGSGDSGSGEGPRPSPHRPGNLNLAQQQQSQSYAQNRDGSDGRGRGGRRSNRNNRSNGRRPSDGPNSQQRDNSTGGKVFSPTTQIETDTPQPDTMSTTLAANSSAPQPATKSRPSSYAYDYLTQDCVSAWTTTGKQGLIDEGAKARTAEDPVALSSIFQEIIQSVFEGRIAAVDGGTCVKSIIGEADGDQDAAGTEDPTSATGKFDARPVFLDILSILTEPETTHPSLRQLVFSTEISPTLMRHQLETPLLQSLGLIRDTFSRMGIKKQTNILYRQSNYNLLREETEGYSKLLTELFTTSNNEPPSSDVVEDTFERVKGMIGAFDMDVGRVLDVTLDVFAAVLVKQYRFCVKFLRASSWWPEDSGALKQLSYSGLPKWALPGSPGWMTTEEEREEALRLNVERDRVFWDRVREVGVRAFFEIGRQVASETSRRKPAMALEGDAADEDETDTWIRETGTLPPKGNRVAAQLLGFKLRFYSSETRSPSDVMPDNLIYLAALLIKVGFISLRDLYPHLWRPDESMDVLKEEKTNEKLEREKAALPGGGGTNALMAAGSLSDDTLPLPNKPRGVTTRAGTPSKDQDQDKAASKPDDKEQLPEPADQKVLLLKSLLAIGALPESLIVLGRFPWLMNLYPDLPEFVHRILHHCLSKVYASVRPFSTRETIKDRRKVVNADQSATPQGRVRLGDPAPRRVLRWALLDKEDINDGTDYRFYWDDWADNIPICQSVDDVFALCGSLLNLSGFKIGQDSSLLSKLSRIGNQSLKDDTSDANKARWRDLCKRLLVPSLSLTKANPGVVNELFALLSHFPRAERYSIYAEWYFGQISRMPEIKTAFDQARAETKDALKRLSKTNIRPMARTLAKVAYANPGIVINVAISQIESYENLIEVVVECARYFTDLAYDILTWSLINSLGQKGRSRVQESGLLTSRWLNALASFAGRAFKRYSSIMNPIPLLEYVGEQLQQNNSTDLIVLEQLISSMAGIVTDTYFNNAQTQAMGGGELLQAQTMLQLLDKRHESKMTSKRLMKALTESKFAGQLLIAIAQERATCVFKDTEGDAELKLLGNIFDEIHRVLTQYVDLLRTNFSVEEFDSFVPDVSSLIGEFGIQPEVAFWISRPSLSQKIVDVDKRSQESAVANKPEVDLEATSKAPDGDIVMEDGQQPEANGPTPGDAMAVDQASDETPTDEQLKDGTLATPTTTKIEGEDFSWHPVLDDLMGKMKTVLPQDTCNVIGVPFYMTFWQLSLYDIYVPQKSYEDELERLKKRVIGISNDRSDISMAGTQRKDREKKQVNELHDRLLDENKRHLKAYGQTRSRLQKEKLRWFEGMRGKHEALNMAIMQQCFLPRILLSPIEALYSFKMLKFLHSSGTPNFRTLGFLDQLFRDQRLTGIIFQSTSKEADNFGRFMNEVLQDLGRWHADKAIYEKEAFGVKRDLPGFSMAMDAAGKPTTLLDYEDFRRILYKWHRILGSSLKTCFTGGEYMHIRNAISVLKAVVQNFPAVNWIGRDMLTCVNNLKTSDPRDDVKIPAASLIGDLNRRESKWLLPQAFMINESMSGDKGAAGKPRTPQPQSETPKSLNAAASEFKPGPTSTNATDPQRPQPDGKMEVEDGEISDVKDTTAKPEKADADQETSEARSTQQPDTTTTTTTAAAQEAATSDTQDQGKEATEIEKSPSPKPTPEQGVESSKEEVETREPPQEQPGRPGSRSETKPTETPVAPTNPKRPDVDRQPNLPNKPEPPRSYRPADARPPPSRQLDVADDRRDSRETRHHENARSAWHGGPDRDRSHDHANAPGYRGRGRAADRDRPEPPAGPRDTGRPSPEEQFGRPGLRDTDPRQTAQGWPERTDRGRPASHDNYPPRNDPQRLSRADDVHPSRSANISRQPERTDVNREPPARQEPPRQERDDRRPYPSRLSSPPRKDDDHLAGRVDRRDERDARRPPPPFPPRHDEPPAGPPAGPRGDRHVPASPIDSRAQPPPQAPGDHRPQPHQPSQDSRFGAPSQNNFERSQDIPSGPRRDPAGRRGRSASTSQTHPAAARQPSPPRQPPPERQPPSGPSNRPMRPPQHQDQSQTGLPPGVATPQPAQIDTSGIHPERLAKMQTSSDAVPAPQPPSPAPALPPSGPRNAGLPPSGPLSTTRGASGAPFPGERGRGDKRFVGLNNMLQQGSGAPADKSLQGTTIRGRAANRPPGGWMDNAMPPQVLVGERPDAHPGATSPGEPDLFTPRLNGSSPQPIPQRPGYEDESRDREARGGRWSETAKDMSAPQASPSGVPTPDRANRDRERDRDGSRRGDDDSARRADPKRDEHRDRARDRDRDRERDRDRDRDRGRSSRDEGRDTRGSRESSSRRGAQSSADNYDGPGGPSTTRRSTRRDRDQPTTEAPAARPGPPPPPPPPPPPQSQSQPQPQPQPPSGPSEDRRWAGSGRADDRARDRDQNRGRDRDRERDNRERERERDSDRDRDKDRRDGGDASRNGGGSGGTWPRKRGRPAGGNADDGQDRRNSLRAGGDKRQRRGQ